MGESQLTLDANEITLIMRGLGKLPLEETFDLFVKLRLHIQGRQPQPTPEKSREPEPPKQADYDPETGITIYPDGRTHNRHTGEIVWPDGTRGHDLVLRRNAGTEHLFTQAAAWPDKPVGTIHDSPVELDTSHLEPYVENGMG